jgi:fibronectin type 3 domain-containing protein
VNGTGSSQLNVTTIGSTPAGTYPLTITGTSGSEVHTASAALVVSAAVQHSVSLTWTDTDSGIAGYNVYRSNQNGTGFTKLNASLATATAFTDKSVQSGSTYYYVVTAVNSGGAESGFSAVVQAVIP